MADQQIDDLFAQSVDVHAWSAAEVNQALFELGGALGTGAADIDAAFVTFQFGVAFRAVFGELELGQVRLSFMLLHTDDFGDDLSGLLDDHDVADANVQPFDLVGVMQ